MSILIEWRTFSFQAETSAVVLQTSKPNAIPHLSPAKKESINQIDQGSRTLSCSLRLWWFRTNQQWNK
jgi:hypothetical protein